MRTQSSQITTKFFGIELTMLYNYFPPTSGSTDKYGVPLEPDDPEDVEILGIEHKGEDIIDLFRDDSLEMLANLLLIAHTTQSHTDMEEREDLRYNEQMYEDLEFRTYE